MQERTGLLLDPYFSATKLAWLLDNVAGARERAAKGELAFGTIDSFLLWRLTDGAVHATDATNASRTMLFDIKKQDWDDDLLTLLDIPRAILPEVKDCSTLFGTTPASLCSAHPFRSPESPGISRRRPSARPAFSQGMLKSTYGTGCFALLNTGDAAVTSTNRLLTTTAYRLNGKPTFAIEGSIFVAGAAVQWLRDGLKLVAQAGDTEAIARRIADTGGVYLVPAFVGLGAPYWDPDARGALIGLTRDSGIDQIVRATLESVAYQTQDLMNAMAGDIQGDCRPTAVRVDGGMVANNWVCQFLADVLNLPVERPKVIETTALGAAYLAGLETGLYGSMDAVTEAWHGRSPLRARHGRHRTQAPLPRLARRRAPRPQWRGHLVDSDRHGLDRRYAPKALNLGAYRQVARPPRGLGPPWPGSKVYAQGLKLGRIPST